MSLTPGRVDTIKTNAQVALEVLLYTLDDATEEIADGAAEIRQLKDQVAELEAELIAERHRYAELEAMVKTARTVPV
jgi:cell division septum initiation protein DivIVA